jgi:hypothetical protein
LRTITSTHTPLKPSTSSPPFAVPLAITQSTINTTNNNIYTNTCLETNHKLTRVLQNSTRTTGGKCPEDLLLSISRKDTTNKRRYPDAPTDHKLTGADGASQIHQQISDLTNNNNTCTNPPNNKRARCDINISTYNVHGIWTNGTLAEELAHNSHIVFLSETMLNGTDSNNLLQIMNLPNSEYKCCTKPAAPNKSGKGRGRLKGGRAWLIDRKLGATTVVWLNDHITVLKTCELDIIGVYLPYNESLSI